MSLFVVTLRRIKCFHFINLGLNIPGSLEDEQAGLIFGWSDQNILARYIICLFDNGSSSFFPLKLGFVIKRADQKPEKRNFGLTFISGSDAYNFHVKMSSNTGKKIAFAVVEMLKQLKYRVSKRN